MRIYMVPLVIITIYSAVVGYRIIPLALVFTVSPEGTNFSLFPLHLLINKIMI